LTIKPPGIHDSKNSSEEQSGLPRQVATGMNCRELANGRFPRSGS